MAPKKPVEQDEVMIVNDSPGEECRIAILQQGHLEELFTERTSTATNVGNIYKGRVTNVEPAIQAAFIDYGEGANGFLHISDLHPKYFPGEERTERVGKKIPRRDRPPIQHALKRGQEILVQVLKEGLGTKGPTLTSYLSIPGRLLVLMPDMDRVGVSRKVEDEDKRREMRQILDSLDLPDGFGFILRTAGYGKTKTELKRDAAYLLRLWKLMEKRIKSVGAPCELYTESDLFIRTIRDVLRPTIKAIVVDSPSAYERASMFLRVVSPRSAPKVIRYARSAPIFHAFDIERQIELIHSREVPLASGGRLVIDQTEALVAIDVNSGRSRSARDSETNAYETNCEAADEICRQLRLRDLGGLIVNDLIDMRYSKHRKAIEERIAANMKRDRAKATVLPISDFGIIEMTRQRMRPSIRKSHFMACPHCSGRGEIKVPEYVAADATRHIGYLLQFDHVKRVELACSPRVASVLLSGKRRELVRLEDAYEGRKRIDVRVSDAIAVDRIDYYAYDDRNADIDIHKLPALQTPSVEELEQHMATMDLPAAGEEAEEQPQREHEPERGRGRRRRRRGGPADSAAIALAGDYGDILDEFEDEVESEPAEARDAANTSKDVSGAAGADDAKSGGKRRRRRGGRKHRRGEKTDQTPKASSSSPAEHEDAAAPEQSVRVHELARELSVSSRELIERSEAEPAIHHLANALSTVSAEEANAIREMFNNGQADDASAPAVADANGVTPPGASEGGRRKRRRRRRGRDRKPETAAGSAEVTNASESAAIEPPLEPIEHAANGVSAAPSEGEQGGRRRRRRRGRRGRGGAQANSVMVNGTGESVPSPLASPPPSAPIASSVASPSSTASAAPKKRRRALYRAARGAVSAAAREVSDTEE